MVAVEHLPRDVLRNAVIRVVIAGDQPVLRRGVRAALESSGLARVVGEEVDADAALDAVRRLEPEVVVMDVDMPELARGATGAVQACARAGTAVVVLADELRGDRLRALRAAGVSAVVSKLDPPSSLVEAVERAARRGPRRPA